MCVCVGGGGGGAGGIQGKTILTRKIYFFENVGKVYRYIYNLEVNGYTVVFFVVFSAMVSRETIS